MSIDIYVCALGGFQENGVRVLKCDKVARIRHLSLTKVCLSSGGLPQIVLFYPRFNIRS